ncbi:DMT family transporter [Alisedimentitalea sp. MJ-SS2]|uniref:DMT family transporter n=1 Tax=Aliisedimentitalea sp. MJ-SS2 TaxID=3049795 RepID=UPI00290BEC28|nr:DMT family transporter [Alisedimentitalea sp. MJ-SS2]MDU8928558.1 DMT family transporter [Alisedimentitalea sp. MJ-SS2]
MDGRDNMKGAGLMMVSMAAFTFNDVCMKELAGDIPLMQAIFLRGVLTSLLIFVAARHMGVLRFAIPRRDWGLIGLRSIAEIGATFSFLTALFHMPIANVTAILQALPLTVALTAAVFFAEPLGWRRMLAIGIGFCGVLMIVQPGADGFSTYSIYALIAVGFVTLRDLSSRRLSPAVPSFTVAFITAVIIACAGGITSIWQGWAPVETRHGFLLAGASLFILGGYLASVAVMRVGEISFIAPFRYTGLIWALVLGYLVFGDWPDQLTLLGAAIVVAMGVFTLYREAAARRATRN